VEFRSSHVTPLTAAKQKMSSSKDSKPNEKPRNPALRMLGIPRLKAKLPSRNWLIFWSSVISLTGIVVHDRREKTKALNKWQRKVQHLALEPLGPLERARKVKVFMIGPPGDTIDVTQKHFNDYIKPILVASATDYELITNSRQGAMRSTIADQIRKKRMTPPTRDSAQAETYSAQFQSRLSPTEEEGGCIIVGRHGYKEYLSGMQEGWLGPLKPPLYTVPQAETDAETEAKKEEPEKKPEAKPPPIPKPYISTEEYAHSPFPNGLDSQAMEPIKFIGHPHILGFLNTPSRIYRFVTRRYLAESIAASTAAVVLKNTRQWNEDEDLTQGISEEMDWPKSVIKAAEKPDNDRTWKTSLVVDPRVGRLLRVYDLEKDYDDHL